MKAFSLSRILHARSCEPNLEVSFLPLASGSAFTFVERNKGSPNEAASWNGAGDCCEYIQNDTTAWRRGLVNLFLELHNSTCATSGQINAVACQGTSVNCSQDFRSFPACYVGLNVVDQADDIATGWHQLTPPLDLSLPIWPMEGSK